MTLLFASHVGKVDTYQHVSKNRDINSEYLSIYLATGIEIYKKLNRKIVKILIVTSLLFVFTTVVRYLGHYYAVLCLSVADLILTIFLIVWIVVVMANVYKQYIKETKLKKF